MLNTFKNMFYRVAAIIALLAVFSVSAYALDLNQAKSQGLVKETVSGYLAAVKPSAEVNALVSKINTGRKAEYQRIAKKNGTPLSSVEQLVGKKLTK